MNFLFYPQRSESDISISINNETIIVNGTEYDLSPLTESMEISTPSFVARKNNNEIEISMGLPYKEDTTIDTMQILTMTVTENGPLDIPGHEYVEPESITVGVIDWPTPVSLEQRRLNKWREVEAYRNNLMQTGGFAVGNYWFHSDLLSRSQQLGLIELGKMAVAAGVDPADPIPNSPPWRTMSGAYVTLTPALTQSLIPAFLVQEASIFAVGDYYRNLINNSNDPESLNITLGWPVTYKDTIA